ncbi:MAG: chorion class high-cysteine HCB protein 13 [Eubacteriales bacterium]|nr:chorion class high-cysteine HCB protein 13 [Eubacteriales bacterium]
MSTLGNLFGGDALTWLLLLLLLNNGSNGCNTCSSDCNSCCGNGTGLGDLIPLLLLLSLLNGNGILPGGGCCDNGCSSCN